MGRLRGVKYWLIKAVLPLVDPTVALTLANINALNAAQMEQSLKKVMKKEKFNLGEGRVTGGIMVFDPRSVRVLTGAQVYLALPDESDVNQEIQSIKVKKVRVLTGAQVYLALPDESDVNQEIQSIKVKKVEEISPNHKYHEGIPPLEIFPNMLISSPPIVENMSYSRIPRRILLNKAGKEALLKLGFVPDYACLRKLKHINNFEIIISSSNALGFLLNLCVRVLYKHLPISPLESLAMYVAIFICFNALAQAVFFTGSTCLCKQTLLIHLTADQLNLVISTGSQIKIENEKRPEKTTSQKWYQVRYDNRYRVLRYLLNLLYLVVCFIADFIIDKNKIYLRPSELYCPQCNWPVYMMLYINYGIFIIVSLFSSLSSSSSTSEGNSGFKKWIGNSGFKKWIVNSGFKKWICSIWLIVSSIVMVSVVLLALSLTFIKWTSLGFDQAEVQHGGHLWYTYIIPHIST